MHAKIKWEGFPMKIDKFLLGIVVGVLLLAVLAVVLVLVGAGPEYMAEDTPVGVAHNYLVALNDGDYERALGYIANCVTGKPGAARSLGRLADEDWNFNDLRQDVSLVVSKVYEGEMTATVIVEQTVFNNYGPLDSRSRHEEFSMRLQNIEGIWKLVEADNYWDSDWSSRRCR
jgi:hypothetical protein